MRIYRAVQGIPVPSLVQENPTCHRATKAACHNYWLCSRAWSRNSAYALQLLKPQHPRAPAPQQEKPSQVLSLCVCTQLLLCLTLCDPMDCSPPGSSVHGIFQARILEWVAISSFSGPSRTRVSKPCPLHCGQTLYH